MRFKAGGGSLNYSGKEYPFTGALVADEYEGQFGEGAQRFPFTVKSRGTQLVFESGNFSSELAGKGKLDRELAIAGASKEAPWTNSLGMPFVPVPGTKVLFCAWETRVGDFEVFVNATHHDASASMRSVGNDGLKERGATWKSPGFPQGAAHPVCGISQKDARAFCSWLTRKEQLEGLLGPNKQYRLPIDWEWSRACGMGSEWGTTQAAEYSHGKTAEVFPWGTQWPPPEKIGNLAGQEAQYASWPTHWECLPNYLDGFPRTAPVGSFTANAYGIYDIAGNVSELCENPIGANEDSYAGSFVRGSSWKTGNREVLVSWRHTTARPVSRSDSVGFRCVLVDSAVAMAVVREGSNRTVEATLRERASSNDGVGDSGKRSQNISGHLQGVTLSDLDNNARSQFNLSAELKGALAAEVLQDSAAFQAGLRQGDVIIEVDRKKVSSSPEALKLIESRKDKTTLLRVWSGGVTHFVAIRNGE